MSDRKPIKTGHRSYPLTAEEHCMECDWDTGDNSMGIGPELRRAVLRHVRETGHCVRVDRTVTHEYGPENRV